MKHEESLLEQALSVTEKAWVIQFFQNDQMREAVKKVLLMGVYHNGTLKRGEPANPLVNFALYNAMNHPEMTNEQLGAENRAAASGINGLELGFQYMELLIPPKEDKGSKNEAR